MFRCFPRKLCTYSLVFPWSLVPTPDTLNKETPTEKKADISVIHEETGYQRLQRMFEVDEFGNLSKEVITVLNVGMMSSLVGAVYGGILHSRVAYMDFMKNNQATTFRDHLDAKRKLQDKVSLSFGKGAFKWGWRLSLFCTSYVGISTVISIYRGKNGIVEHVAAGGMTGMLYKFNMGPRGWIIGGGLGASLGVIAGTITWGLIKASGMSMDEVRYWQQFVNSNRDNYVKDGIANYYAKEEEEIMKKHMEIVSGSDKIIDGDGAVTK